MITNDPCLGDETVAYRQSGERSRDKAAKCCRFREKGTVFRLAMCHTQALEMAQLPSKRSTATLFGRYLTNDTYVITLVQPRNIWWV